MSLIFILAPHPFYPRGNCLKEDFLRNIDVFDGIEYCHYYCRGYNPYNKKAATKAKKYNKPMIGTSDAHRLFQFNKTYSLIDANKNIKEVIRKNILNPTSFICDDRYNKKQEIPKIIIIIPI